MGMLFWSLSTDPAKQAASQAALMTAHFNITGEKLREPKEPKQEVIEIPAASDTDLEEISKFMVQAPTKRWD